MTLPMSSHHIQQKISNMMLKKKGPDYQCIARLDQNNVLL